MKTKQVFPSRQYDARHSKGWCVCVGGGAGGKVSFLETSQRNENRKDNVKDTIPQNNENYLKTVGAEGCDWCRLGGETPSHLAFSRLLQGV